MLLKMFFVRMDVGCLNKNIQKRKVYMKKSSKFKVLERKQEKQQCNSTRKKLHH